MKLSEHFTLDELTNSELAKRKGWDNQPPPACYENLIRLAKLLEEVRAVIGKPISINSGYRSKIVNDAVGSKESSQHRLGCAADFHVVGMSVEDIMRAIIDTDIRYDQLIREYDSWVHISVPINPSSEPREQALIIDKTGTRPYIKTN